MDDIESILMDTTQTALFTLGEQFVTLGVVPTNPLVPLVQASLPVKTLTQQFWQKIALCDLDLTPPRATPGADDLERTHRQAACIEDLKAREATLQRAMAMDEEYLTQLQVAETSYRGYVDNMHAPLSTSHAVGQAITKILRQYDSTLVQLCSDMNAQVAVIGIDRQLQMQEEGRSVRTQLEQDLFSDKHSMAAARIPVRDSAALHERPQQHLSSLYHLMVHIVRDRNDRAMHNIDSAADTAFTPAMLSVYNSNWTIATARSMKEARLPPSLRSNTPLSPFNILHRGGLGCGVLCVYGSYRR
jgi:hypothetical protein